MKVLDVKIFSVLQAVTRCWKHLKACLARCVLLH